MVNVTYDACKCPGHCPPSFTDHLFVAGDLNWVDGDGKTVVYNLGDIGFVIAATALVWIMIPGVGFFYSGLLRRKNALSMIWTSLVSIGIVSFQWFFWGFSLAFSETGSAYIGDLSKSSSPFMSENTSINWKLTHSFHTILHLSAYVRCHHRRPRRGRHR